MKMSFHILLSSDYKRMVFCKKCSKTQHFVVAVSFVWIIELAGGEKKEIEGVWVQFLRW